MSLTAIFSYNGRILAPVFYWGMLVCILCIVWFSCGRPARQGIRKWYLVALWTCHFLMIWFTASRLTMFKLHISSEMPMSVETRDMCLLVNNAVGLICCISAVLVAMTLNQGSWRKRSETPTAH